MYLHVLSLTVLSTSSTNIYMLVYRMGTPPGNFWKETGMHLVLENGKQQYYKCPWCLPSIFCGELCSHHLCQITLILNFFEHELGNSNFPVTVLLPLAAVEDISACWENSEICPLTSGTCCNWAVSAVFVTSGSSVPECQAGG